MSTALKTVGIVVQDMGKTLAFYRKLGLAIAPEADTEDNVDFTTPEGVVLGFLTEAVARRADPAYTTPSGSSLNLQFICQTPSEVDDVHGGLVDAGYASYAAPWDTFWGQRFARVVDPDSRIVNLYAEL